MSADTVTIWNNRLGITTLAPPKELHDGARAALLVQLTLAPGASVTLPREIWQLMARRPGNQALALTGEISTRRADSMRRTPPSNLEKFDRRTLGAPKGPSDFVHGLAADPALLRDVEQARKSSRRGPSAQAALASTQPGDYEGLLRALAAEGVSLEALRQHLDTSSVAVKPAAQNKPESKPVGAPTNAPESDYGSSVPSPNESASAEQPKPETPQTGERSSGRSGGKRS